MKRIIGMSLAGLMATQSVAFAQVDRTAFLTEDSISQAQAQLSALRTDILALDKALEATAATIEKRDNSGGILNGISIAGAGIGVGMSVVSLLSARSRSEGAGFSMILAGLVAVSASASSALMGGGSSAFKADIDTKKIIEQLETADKEIAFNLVGQSSANTRALRQLSASVSTLKKSLATYQGKEDVTDNAKVMSHIAQVVGSALVVYSLTDRSSNSGKLATTGLIIMNAANVSRIVAGMTSSQAELVLKEIAAVRTTLQINADYLE